MEQKEYKIQQSISGNQYHEAVDFARSIGLQRLDQRDFGFLLKKLGFI